MNTSILITSNGSSVAFGVVQVNGLRMGTSLSDAAANTAYINGLLSANVGVREMFVLPAGSFYFTNIRLQTDKFLRGQHSGLTYLYQDSSTTGPFVSVGDYGVAAIKTNFGLGGVSLMCQGPSRVTDATNHGIYHYVSKLSGTGLHCWYDDVFVRDTKGVGFWCDSRGEVYVSNLVTYNTGYDGIYWNTYDSFIQQSRIGQVGANGEAGFTFGGEGSNNRVSDLKIFTTGNSGTPGSDSPGMIIRGRLNQINGLELQDIRGHGIVFDGTGTYQPYRNVVNAAMQNIDFEGLAGRCAVVFSGALAKENVVTGNFDSKYGSDFVSGTGSWMSSAVRFEGAASPTDNTVILGGHLGVYNSRQIGTIEESTAGYSKNNLVILNGVVHTKRDRGLNSGETVPAGYAGQVIELNVDHTSAVALSSGTAANVGSVALPAGRWRVTWNLSLVFAAATSATSRMWGVNTTSATIPGNNTEQRIVLNGTYAPGAVTDQYQSSTAIIDNASAGTIYLVANCSFTGGTLSAFGAIRAERL